MTPAVAIFYGLVAAHVLLVGLILWSLFTEASAPVPRAGDRWMIRPARSILWCGVILAIWTMCGVAVLVDGLVSGDNAGAAIIVGGMLIPVASALTVTTLLRYLRNRISWNAEHIWESRWNTRTRRHAWVDLTHVVERTPSGRYLPPPGVTHRPNLREVALHFADGSDVRAAANMTGYAGFVVEVRRIAEGVGARTHSG